jgi:NADPH:quinone reductase-like Zn-dependent oxidoreductase
MLVMGAERFGGPQVLTARQVPDPVAGPGQVVVRTSAADVLFVDTFIRAEAFRQRAAAALAEAAAGRLSPVIGQEYPLAGAADAHAALESRLAVAKTLLRP